MESDEWDVVESSDNVNHYHFKVVEQVSYSELETTFDVKIPGFVLNINMRRYPIYYVYNIIAPTIIISATGLFTVLIPPGPDKVNMAVTVLLGFFFVQTITGDLFPRTQDTPFLAKYTLSALIISTINLLSCLVISGVAAIPDKKKPGQKLAKFLYYLSRAMFHRVDIGPSAKRKPENGDKDQGIEMLPMKGQSEEEVKLSKEKKKHCEEEEEEEKEGYWKGIAVVLNRLFSLCYLIAAIAVGLGFLLPIFF